MSITVLSNAIGAVPSHEETVISQMARTIYGSEGFGYLMYVLTMAGAFAVLFMAANTPFADFPQLAALHSSSGWRDLSHDRVKRPAQTALVSRHKP